MPKILITAGGTSEKIDDVRVITNVSTGRLGAFIADEFAGRHKAGVVFLCGQNSVLPKNKNIQIIKITSAADLQKDLARLLKTDNFDAVIHAMAVSDYSPVKYKGKISSDKETLSIVFKKTPKIIKMIKKLSPGSLLVGFKLLSNVTEKELIKNAVKVLKENKCAFVFANDLKNIAGERHIGFLIDNAGNLQRSGTKKEAARLITKNVMVNI